MVTSAQSEIHVGLDGRQISLGGLDDEERKLGRRLKRRAKTHPDWNDFENYWTRALREFYEERGLKPRQMQKTAVYAIAQDLAGRLAVEAGLARPPDYRDELADLIRRRFHSRREFCEATDISEDMLSHVLARRKHLSIDKLQEALSRIDCTLRIVPLETPSHKD